MGLAASQARYLSLTARKTNVEYEGQQVNQERTMLANQSAALYNEMLSLDVPTPPSATDYTKTIYTFTDPSQLNGTTTIDTILKNALSSDGTQTYTLNITNKITVNTANKVNFSDIAFGKSTAGKPIVYPEGKAGKSYTLQDADTQGTLYSDFNNVNGNTDFDENSKFYSFYNGNDGTFYYIPAQTDENGDIYSAEELVEQIVAGNIKGKDLPIYAVQTTIDNEPSKIKDAILSMATDGTGRYTYVSYFTEDKYETVDGKKQLKEGVTENDRSQFKLTQSTIQDDDAFDAAMETYEAKKAIYDKTVSEINAKTEIIQQQDRTLELHLDQLDTEQQAIQTELDAVKKVIDKNIDETFKIFA